MEQKSAANLMGAMYIFHNAKFPAKEKIESMTDQSVLYNFHLFHALSWPSLFCRKFLSTMKLAEQLLCYSPL